MSKITTLAECTASAFAIIRIELVEANETPGVVIIRWPVKPPCYIRDGSQPLLRQWHALSPQPLCGW